MQSQSGQPHSAAGMAMTMPANPIMEPTDRSNSPAIISSAAATAMIPSCAETSRKVTTPSMENIPLRPATIAKNNRTRIAPATAPSSGRIMSRRMRGVCLSRSSGCAEAAVMLLLPVMPSGPGLRPDVPGSSLAAGAAGWRRRRASSADALLAQIDDFCRIVLGHEAGTREDVGTRHQSVLVVEIEQGDRQVALQELLLVDCEHHLAVPDSREHPRGQVESAELHLLEQIQFLERLQGRLGGGRSQGENAVCIGMRLKIGLDGAADRGGIIEIDGHHVDSFSEALGKALTAQVEGDV